jgi:peptidoglycan L-alanyl-D-glutamate endopeptidase CwlK
MYKFSQRSLDNLETCHPDLQDLAQKVMSYQLVDFGISEGKRLEEEQNNLFATGKSKLKFPDSKHNSSPSEAFDYFVLPNGRVDWEEPAPWYMFVGLCRAAAAELGIKIRCGADWDGDFTAKDQSFHDLPHIELLEA